MLRNFGWFGKNAESSSFSYHQIANYMLKHCRAAEEINAYLNSHGLADKHIDAIIHELTNIQEKNIEYFNQCVNEIIVLLELKPTETQIGKEILISNINDIERFDIENKLYQLPSDFVQSNTYLEFLKICVRATNFYADLFLLNFLTESRQYQLDLEQSGLRIWPMN